MHTTHRIALTFAKVNDLVWVQVSLHDSHVTSVRFSAAIYSLSRWPRLRPGFRLSGNGNVMLSNLSYLTTDCERDIYVLNHRLIWPASSVWMHFIRQIVQNVQLVAFSMEVCNYFVLLWMMASALMYWEFDEIEKKILWAMRTHFGTATSAN